VPHNFFHVARDPQEPLLRSGRVVVAMALMRFLRQNKEKHAEL